MIIEGRPWFVFLVQVAQGSWVCLFGKLTGDV